MEAYPCVAELLPGNGVYQIIEGQYFIPEQGPNVVHEETTVSSNPTLQVFQNVETVNAASSIVGVVPVNSQLQVTSNGNAPPANGYIIGNNYYIQQPATNVQENVGSNSYLDGVQTVEIITQNPSTSQTKQFSINSNEINTSVDDFQKKTKPPECVMKKMVKIPEPTQVKIDTNLRERVAGLKIQISGSFMSWNVAGRTILDLNFMRNLFYITKIDIVFEPNISYEAGVNEGLKKLVDTSLFSDWLVLKCEEKQMPFFKVSNQVEIYSVNNFTTLLSIIAQESCLPLPFITGHEKNMKYFYLNFPKTFNNRVKKLNTPIFHDADNGRKKIPCKYPGIRLDCSFESAIQRFVIHVQKSAVSAFRKYVTYLRQVLIYNHIVWGFLQAWTRRIREQYNGCFKVQEIAQNLSLCQGDVPQTGKSPSDVIELIYYIDYLNFYLKFDPVTLRDTTVSFTIENFETNFVCDVSLIQYYRQFFLINDMHYSDALTNIVLFSEENGGSNVTEFVYMTQKNNGGRSKEGFSPPGGISRSSSQQQIPGANKKTDLPADIQSSDHAQTQVINAPNTTGVQVPQRNLPAVKGSSSRPLIKTRTVEEINFAVDMKKCSNKSQLSFDSIMTGQLGAKGANQPSIPPSITEALNHCYVKNVAEICRQDVSRDPKVLQQIFNDALQKAMEMRSVEAFIEKLYVTLQKFFTNLTCQLIMNRTIKKALEVRFPHLKSRLSWESPVQREPRLSTAVSESPTVQENQNVISLPERVSETAVNKTVQMVSSRKTQPIPNPQNIQSKTIQWAMPETNPPNPPTVNPSVSMPLISRNPNFPKTSSPMSPVKSIFKENSTPNKINVIPKEKPDPSTHIINNEMDRSESEKQPEKGKGSDGSDKKPLEPVKSVELVESVEPVELVELVESVEPVEPVELVESVEPVELMEPGAVNVTSACMTVVETESNISIELTLPLSTNAENKIVGEAIPGDAQQTQNRVRTPIRGDRNSEQNEVLQKEQEEPKQQEEISSSVRKEQDIIARYNLKPCSIILNTKDVANYKKKQEKHRKRKRKTVSTRSTLSKDGDNSSDDNLVGKSDDSRDSDFVPEPTRKKRRKTSELQFLEARTRVLQRLRKRDPTYALSGGDSYPLDELQQFLFQTPQSRRSSSSSASGKQKSDSQYWALYNECLTRKATVVLIRFEDTPEYHEQKSKWRVETKADGRLTLTRDYSEEYNNLPKNKRKYFEVKEGKFYLKKQYQVKNGQIVLVNSETDHENIHLKDEPPSTEHELYFSPSCIKREGSSD